METKISPIRLSNMFIVEKYDEVLRDSKIPARMKVKFY